MNCTLCGKPMDHLNTTVQRPPNPEITYLEATWSCPGCEVIVEVQTRIASPEAWRTTNEIFGRKIE